MGQAVGPIQPVFVGQWWMRGGSVWWCAGGWCWWEGGAAGEVKEGDEGEAGTGRETNLPPLPLIHDNQEMPPLYSV